MKVDGIPDITAPLFQWFQAITTSEGRCSLILTWFTREVWCLEKTAIMD